MARCRSTRRAAVSSCTSKMWELRPAGQPAWRSGRDRTLRVAMRVIGRLVVTAEDPASTIQPGGRQPSTEVIPEIRRIVLQGALPRRDAEAGVDGDVVLLPGEVALDLVDQLPSLDGVERTPLAHDQVRHHRIVDVALVSRLVGHVVAIEIAIGLEKVRLGSERHRVELALKTGREVGAVFLLIDLRIDADVLEVLQHELYLVDEDAGAVRGEAHARRETVRVARRRHQPLSLAEIVLVVLRPVAELIDRERPLPEPR